MKKLKDAVIRESAISHCFTVPKDTCKKVYKWVWESEMLKDESFGKMRMNALWLLWVPWWKQSIYCMIVAYNVMII